MSHLDVLVIGGGPAGSAAAITARQGGLNVTLIEAQSFPRYRPGESLHPGIQPLLKQLGIEQQILAANYLRYSGQWNWHRGYNSFEPFGEDKHGPWLGFQIPREELDSCLLNQAKLLGVKVLQPCKALQVLTDNDEVVGVSTSQGDIYAKYVIDASGHRHWLTKQLNSALEYHSAPLYARYGYAKIAKPSDVLAQPQFKVLENEWQWHAQVSKDTIHWTRLYFDSLMFNTEQKAARRQLHKRLHHDITSPPKVLAHLSKVGLSKGADVSWRKAKMLASNSYYVVGDAAFVLDPASSHGVLKAVMSGIYAANLVTQVVHHRLPRQSAAPIYNDWLTTWFLEDAQKLKSFYHQSLTDPIM
ncbi:NAD(P)/FAD-dependent oxidoreductase [Pseudoalteromonas sp. S16_S37]|uniref:NAD(P)/FAD-dependent oxidoreductase n=1 Tax=Pseudoalteromonas sp. S16_S37 TaxID=2720228 RepID=UPI0016817D44|nr:tryptophan 7-halogenase [Pseudoalteromonas sp. S16_S37]MBD1584650.1 FAD-binding protein [Pseudoalteromonas sp. S16_S37]